ncbi:hypothetical protein Clacol_006471 [Clathrus columnatus]|uniref:Uncharacterized protein n=1 Tax=Clathrus columnatus TaxID=1419009 RepID=A0AAV5AH68_9AGAM|nr:hypothetical protein Clacol_006471 [Clathrus columnatus]
MPVFAAVAPTLLQLGSKKPRRSKTDRMSEENARLVRRVRTLEKRLRSSPRNTYSAENSNSPSSEGGDVSSSSFDPFGTVADIGDVYEDPHFPDFLSIYAQDGRRGILSEENNITLIKRSDFPVLSERAKRLIPGCKFTLDVLFHLYRENGLLEDDAPTLDQNAVMDSIIINDPDGIQHPDILSHPQVIQELTGPNHPNSVIDNETASTTTNEAEPMSSTIFPPPFPLESMEDIQQFFDLVLGGF